MKKNLYRKKVTAVLTAAVIIASLAGCGQQTGEPENTEVKADEETVEISIATWNADEAFLSDDDILTTIEEKLNIKIVPENITWDDYVQKIQLWASSGSLPDLFVGDFRNSVSYPQWADQGVIKAIPDDLSAYPELEEYLSGQAAEEAKLDGTLYCIPRQSYPSQEWTSIDRLISYRWDLAQAAGITKEPETWDEFQEMVLAIIEADPEGNGIGGVTASDKGLLGGMFMPYASAIAADGGSAFKWVAAEDGSYQPAYFYEDVVEGFQLARDLYDAGVIEKDIALTTNQTAEEKFLQGKSAAIIMSGGFGNKYLTVSRFWDEVHGSSYTDDVKALKLMPDKNGEKTYPVWSYAWSESFINANVDDAKLDKILQLYNYLLTDEGAFLSTYGPEGELYEMVDGKVEMKDPDTVVKDFYASSEALASLVKWNPYVYDERYASDFPPEYNEVNKELVAEALEVEVPEYIPRCTQLLMELEIDFTVNFDEDFLNVMTGAEPVEEMWGDLVKQYEEKGLQDMIDQVNAAMESE